jgi:hypothetical protein
MNKLQGRLQTLKGFVAGLLVSVVIGGVAIAAPQYVAPSTHKVKVDGKSVEMSGYAIDGYNYFKLRDVASAVDFGLWFDESASTVMVETDKGYDAGYTGPSVGDVATPNVDTNIADAEQWQPTHPDDYDWILDPHWIEPKETTRVLVDFSELLGKEYDQKYGVWCDQYEGNAYIDAYDLTNVLQTAGIIDRNTSVACDMWGKPPALYWGNGKQHTLITLLFQDTSDPRVKPLWVGSPVFEVDGLLGCVTEALQP